MKDKVRVAVIGAGKMANAVHYPSLASFHDVEISGIRDFSPEALKETADKYGIENRYADYRQMVEEVKPDAVYAIGQPIFCMTFGCGAWTGTEPVHREAAGHHDASG